MSADRMSPTSHLVLLGVLAIVVLCVGTAVYVFDRGPGSITVFPSDWTGLGSHRQVFGPIGDSLPSFTHAFGFTLLTALMLRRERSALFVACTGWSAFGAAFESGQHPSLAGPLVAALSGPLERLPGAHSLAGYFARGTFDSLDLLATVAGAIGAAAILATVRRWDGRLPAPRP